MKKIFACLLCCILVGCATMNVGRNFDDSKVKKFRTGVTTQAEVVEALGQPWMKTANSDGLDIWTYMHSVSSSAVDPASFFVPFYTGVNTDTETKTLVLAFKHGVLTKTDTSSTAQESKTVSAPFYAHTYSVDPKGNRILKGDEVVLDAGDAAAIIKVTEVPKEQSGEFVGRIIRFESPTGDPVESSGDFEVGTEVTFTKEDVRQKRG